MTDTSGPTSPTPFAFYDPDSSCWRTSQGTFPWDSTPSSVTWPTSGMTLGGRAFPLRLSAPRIDATGSGSLLLTPMVGGMVNGPSASEIEAGNPKHRLEVEIAVMFGHPLTMPCAPDAATPTT